MASRHRTFRVRRGSVRSIQISLSPPSPPDKDTLLGNFFPFFDPPVSGLLQIPDADDLPRLSSPPPDRRSSFTLLSGEVSLLNSSCQSLLTPSRKDGFPNGFIRSVRSQVFSLLLTFFCSGSLSYCLYVEYLEIFANYVIKIYFSQFLVTLSSMLLCCHPFFHVLYDQFLRSILFYVKVRCPTANQNSVTSFLSVNHTFLVRRTHHRLFKHFRFLQHSHFLALPPN